MQQINDLSKAYLDRIYLTQISNMLAQNMLLFHSVNLPSINSAALFPRGLSSPNMFHQIQGAVASIAGEPIAQLMNFATDPMLRSLLPAPISNFIGTLLQSAPIGGVSDPGSFLEAQLYRRVGIGVPQITLPNDFQSMYDTDIYIAQKEAFQRYAGISGTGTQLQPLILPSETDSEVLSRNQIIAARNTLQLRNEDSGFSNVYDMLNSMAAFGPRLDLDETLQKLQPIQTETEAADFLKNEIDARRVRQIVDKGQLASGLIGATQYLAGFIGATPEETAQMRGLGDFVTDILRIGNNRNQFSMTAPRTLAEIGGLATAMGLDQNGNTMPVANILASRLADRIDDKSGVATGMNEAGFIRSQRLISELGRIGLVATGGADIYGAMTPEDVAKMEEALVKQLEGFSAIEDTGRRLGMKVTELVQNLQTVYGGRINQTIDDAASRIFQTYENIDTDGNTVGLNKLIVENNRRRVAGITELDTNIKDPTSRGAAWLRLQAQREAGEEIAKELGDTVELGRMAGLDSQGVMAIAATTTQMLQNINMGGQGSMDLTNEILSTFLTSRNDGGAPITMTQSIAAVTSYAQAALNDPSSRAYAIIRQGVREGTLKRDDPAVQKLIQDYEQGRPIDPGALGELFKGREGLLRNYQDRVPSILASYSEEFIKYYSTGQYSYGQRFVDNLRRTVNASTNTNLDADALIAKIGNKRATILDQIVNSSVEDAKKYLESLNFNSEEIESLMSAGLSTVDTNSLTGAPGDRATAGNVIKRQADVEQGKTDPARIAQARNSLKNYLQKELGTNSAGTALRISFDRVYEEKANKLFEKLLEKEAAAGSVSEERKAQLRIEAKDMVNAESLSMSEFIQAISGGGRTVSLEALKKRSNALSSEIFDINRQIASAPDETTREILQKKQRQLLVEKHQADLLIKGSEYNPPQPPEVEDREAAIKKEELEKQKSTSGNPNADRGAGTVVEDDTFSPHGDRASEDVSIDSTKVEPSSPTKPEDGKVAATVALDPAVIAGMKDIKNAVDGCTQAMRDLITTVMMT